MKKGFFSVILIIVLIAAIVIIPMLNVRKPEEVVADKTIKPLSATLLENTVSQQEEDAFLPTDKVTFIVELSTPCLLDTINALSEETTVGEYVFTEEGKQQLQNILREQALVKAEVKRTISDADFSNTISYKTVVNGFTITAYYSSLKKLEEVQGVKNIFVSREITTAQNDEDSSLFNSLSDVSEESIEEASKLWDESKKDEDEPVENLDTEPQVNPEAFKNYSSNKMVGSYHNMGYTGNGIKIAVIDTGFDIEHEAFSALSPSMTEQLELQKYIESGVISLSSQTKISDVQYNSKIIFAYDYGDKDYILQDTDTHGTSMAGIIAGNNNKITEEKYAGIAQDSNLMLLKVSRSGEKYIQDAVILSALDDAAAMNVDIVNISINAERINCGTTIFTDTLFERLYSAGIFVSVAAGNYGDAEKTADTLPKTEHIDYGNTGLFAESKYVFVSAAVKNTVSYKNALLFNNIIKIVPYNAVYEENGEEHKSLFEVLSGNYPYVYVDEESRTRNWADMNLDGKIVVLRADELTEETAEIIGLCDAVALLLLDGKEKETPLVLSADMIPVARIDTSCNAVFELIPEGELEISQSCFVTEPSQNTGMAEYSAYGATDSLKIGVDISAPGGEVYAPAGKDQYTILNGTSVSAAETSGAVAILKEYISNDSRFASLSKREKNDMLCTLLMSTAEPVFENEDVYASPRLQGSGLLQIDKALQTKAYITVAGETRPKSQKGEYLGSEFNFSFRVYNIGDTDLNYTLQRFLQTDAAVEIENVQYNTLCSKSVLEYASVETRSNKMTVNRITIPAQGWVDVQVHIQLNRDFIEEQKKAFVNGFFTEGFLLLIPDNEATPKLSIPFMSFCGDWESEDVLNRDDNSDISDVSLYTAVYDTSRKNYTAINMGYNVFTEQKSDKLVYSSDWYKNYLKAWKLKTSSSQEYKPILVPSVNLNRYAENITVSLNDADNTRLYNQNINIFSDDVLSLAGIFYQSNKFPQLKEGNYRYAVTVDSPFGEEADTVSFPITVDKTSPKALGSSVYVRNEKIYLTLNAKDNVDVQGFMLYVAVYDSKTDKYSYIDSIQALMESSIIEKDAVRFIKQETNEDEVRFIYDITNLKEALTELVPLYKAKYGITTESLKIVWSAVDYAWNMSEPMVANVEPSGSITLRFENKDGSPIYDVWVQLGNQEGVSDENGEIVFENLSPAVYAVHIVSSPVYIPPYETAFDVQISLNNLYIGKKVILNGQNVQLSDYHVTNNNAASNTSDENSDSSADVSLDDSKPSEERKSSFSAWIFVSTLLVISVIAMFISRKRYKK